MSPSISATNANILMQSDYFIVPCAPDYFCYMAIESLISIFPKWCSNYNKMAMNEVFQSATYKMKETPPIFLETIQQRYRPRNGSPARAFADWIAEINKLVSDKLIPVFLLTQDQVQKTGTAWMNMKRNRDDFFNTFQILATRIIEAIQ